MVELREKIGKAYALNPAEMAAGMQGETNVLSDAIGALIALGYSPREAREALMRLKFEGEKPIEEVIKEALKVLV